jgi:hypothetical protein
VEEYVGSMNQILDRKIDIYEDLQMKFRVFKMKLIEEEKASHTMVMGVNAGVDAPAVC